TAVILETCGGGVATGEIQLVDEKAYTLGLRVHLFVEHIHAQDLLHCFALLGLEGCHGGLQSGSKVPRLRQQGDRLREGKTAVASVYHQLDASLELRYQGGAVGGGNRIVGTVTFQVVL